MLSRELLTALRDGREQRIERFLALQVPQVPGVRARDVDRHVIGVRVDAGQAGQ